jgi:hypothetical protein
LKFFATCTKEIVPGKATALGITFEFWENLALRFFKDPNFHDEEIWDIITKRLGSLNLVHFTKKETFYLTLMSVLKKKEWYFYEENL